MTSQPLHITLAQLNLTVGDFSGNIEKILAAREQAISEQSDLIVYSELATTGYPPEDLILRPSFQHAAMDALHELAEETADSKTAMLVGTPWIDGHKLYNAAALLYDGKIQKVQYKHDLPNYGVFDEKRLFQDGPLPEPIPFKNIKLGIMICEDLWNMKVTNALTKSDIILSMNASPFEVGKHRKRLDRAGVNIRALQKPLIYVNGIYGHDDLVFDGDSFVLSHQEEILLRLSRTEEKIVTTHWHYEGDRLTGKEGIRHSYECEDEVIYQAMILGLRDYVTKNGFPGVVIGLSGGIDSVLSAAIAVDALGADKVRLVMLPSRFTSQESLNDAQATADMLGVILETLPIEDMVVACEDLLAPAFDGLEHDITEENIQARVRGTLLMAISNKFGHMVLATGNKSEMSTGYATLYGDMCGGYNVLKDAYKTQVTALARWRNNHKPENGLGPEGAVIPDNVITKAPTAELRHDQKDEDNLPPYNVLDQVLIKLIEEEMSAKEIIAEGFDEEMVKHVRKMVWNAEYKRRQSPPGVKISKKPFGRDRRYPITNKFGG